MPAKAKSFKVQKSQKRGQAAEAKKSAQVKKENDIEVEDL